MEVAFTDLSQLLQSQNCPLHLRRIAAISTSRADVLELLTRDASTSVSYRTSVRLAVFIDSMKLPTAKEINPIPEDLDGQFALRHFLGKNLEEAEALFRENSLRYQEDLMWMGAIAFRFYVQAVINYIHSESATGDADIINCFAGILEFRLEHEEKELQLIASLLADTCAYIITCKERFDLEIDVYGDFRGRYQTLQQQFKNMSV